MSDFQDRLRRVLANRHSPEAAAFYKTLLEYIDKRVAKVSRVRCRGLLTESEREEVVADVLLVLMSRSLSSFRGGTMPELIAFVRTICDRTLWRAAGARIKERKVVEALTPHPVGHRRMLRSNSSDGFVELTPSSPLASSDQAYLVALLESGSKANHARACGVSRAAVTQRIQRIRARIAELPDPERMAHDVWITQRAREALEVDAAASPH
jgi:DNA-directed RNA polymerase specialized sigma24 family protein